MGLPKTIDMCSSEQLEIEMLKAKISSLELQVQWLNKNWVDWTKSTQNIGQKLIFALENLVDKKDTTPVQQA